MVNNTPLPSSAKNAKPPAYYVPEQSRWPIVASFGLFLTALGAATVVQQSAASDPSPLPPLILLCGGLLMAWILFGWFANVIHESRGGLYSEQVGHSFRLGMGWFIFSEVMFFAAFFGALFYSRQWAVPWLGGEGDKGVSNMLWPDFVAQWPVLITPDMEAFPGPAEVIGPWGIPLVNTILLVSSSFTLTIAHNALKENRRGSVKIWLLASIALGVTFLGFQAWEYVHAYTELGLTLHAGIYGATFFILTGFHGAHVTLGAIMLTVMWLRILKGHFDSHHHFGFEAAAWYWHFVDVVWICLFLFVYVL